jgi:hypothetical protein
MSGPPDLPHVPFPGVAECRRLSRNYARRRKAYRKRHPDRTHDIETAVYVAPEHLRPLLPEDRERSQ